MGAFKTRIDTINTDSIVLHIINDLTPLPQPPLTPRRREFQIGNGLHSMHHHMIDCMYAPFTMARYSIIVSSSGGIPLFYNYTFCQVGQHKNSSDCLAFS